MVCTNLTLGHSCHSSEESCAHRSGDCPQVNLLLLHFSHVWCLLFVIYVVHSSFYIRVSVVFGLHKNKWTENLWLVILRSITSDNPCRMRGKVQTRVENKNSSNADPWWTNISCQKRKQQREKKSFFPVCAQDECLKQRGLRWVLVSTASGWQIVSAYWPGQSQKRTSSAEEKFSSCSLSCSLESI